MGCCLSVPEAEVAFIEEWGKFKYVAHSGFHCFNCCSTSVRGILPLNPTQATLRIETRTHDNVFVVIQVAIRYQVAKEAIARQPSIPPPVPHMDDGRGVDANGNLLQPLPPVIPSMGAAPQAWGSDHQMSLDELYYHAFYGARGGIQEFMRATCEAFLRRVVMNYTLDQLYTIKDDIVDTLTASLNQELGPLGYMISKVLLTDIDPDANVKNAMNAIMVAEKARQAAQIKAEADRVVKVENARAESEVSFLNGQGLARARAALVDGLKESTRAFQEAIPEASGESVLKALFINAHLDVMREAVQNGHHTFIFPSSPAHTAALEGEVGMALQVNRVLAPPYMASK